MFFFRLAQTQGQKKRRGQVLCEKIQSVRGFCQWHFLWRFRREEKKTKANLIRDSAHHAAVLEFRPMLLGLFHRARAWGMRIRKSKADDFGQSKCISSMEWLLEKSARFLSATGANANTIRSRRVPVFSTTMEIDDILRLDRTRSSRTDGL